MASQIFAVRQQYHCFVVVLNRESLGGFSECDTEIAATTRHHVGGGGIQAFAEGSIVERWRCLQKSAPSKGD